MFKISSTINCKNIQNKRIKDGLPVYNLGLGENIIKQPDVLIENLKKFSDKKHYTTVNGISYLKNELKKNYSSKNFKVDKVIVGNGLKELLFIIQLCFDGKIFHINPSWVSYYEQIKILNKEDDLVEVNTDLNNKFKIDLLDLENKFKKYKNEKKIIIFNNPCNPTGLLRSENEIKNLAELLKKYNCIVLADEIYQEINHFNIFKSISEFIPNLTIKASSISKDMGCGGYRLGWLLFPKKLEYFYNKCAAYSSSIYTCSSVPIQYAVAETLCKNKSELINHYKFLNYLYKMIFLNVFKILKKSKLKYIEPNSSWYIFINFDNYKDKLKKIDIDNSYKLSSLLLEKLGIINVAGENFNIKGLNIRFSLVDINTEFIKLPNKFEEKAFRNILIGFQRLVKYIESI